MHHGCVQLCDGVVKLRETECNEHDERIEASEPNNGSSSIVCGSGKGLFVRLTGVAVQVVVCLSTTKFHLRLCHVRRAFQGSPLALPVLEQ